MKNEGASKIVSMRDIFLETNISCKLLLKYVRHVPDVRLNLISIGMLDDDSYINQIGEGKLKLIKSSLVLAKGRKINSPYVIKVKIKKEDVNVAAKDYNIET